jgi:hypothetical protein
MLNPHEDQSHERIWRQMLRWLATDAPQRLEVILEKDNYHLGDQISLQAKLLNQQFEPQNDGLLWLEITAPDGSIKEQAMEWVLEKQGTYNAVVNVEQEGIYDLKVKVPSELSSNLSAQAPLLVSPSRREYLQAEMDSGLLKRMADTAKGHFYAIDQTSNLIDDIVHSPNAYSRQEVRSFWDQPLFLLLLFLLVAIEWCGRRFKGLS